jgi:hypothetical protein
LFQLVPNAAVVRHTLDRFVVEKLERRQDFLDGGALGETGTLRVCGCLKL